MLMLKDEIKKAAIYKTCVHTNARRPKPLKICFVFPFENSLKSTSPTKAQATPQSTKIFAVLQ